MFLRRLVKRAVARAVGQNRATPTRADDVHVAGAGLDHDAGAYVATADVADRSAEAGDQLATRLPSPGSLEASIGQGDQAARSFHALRESDVAWTEH